jgi:hypothetical protein
MKIVLSSLRVPSSLLETCLQFAKTINVEAEIKLVLLTENGSDAVEKDSVDGCAEAKQIINDLSKLLPEVSGLKVDVRRTGNLNRFWQADAEEDPETLLVVPVSEIAGSRKTSFGTSPDTVVRYLNHPAVLFWMEEQEVNLPAEEAASTAKAKAK